MSVIAKVIYMAGPAPCTKRKNTSCPKLPAKVQKSEPTAVTRNAVKIFASCTLRPENSPGKPTLVY